MRTFVPENFNVDNVKEVEKLYQSLLDENLPNSPDALRAWILKWSELGSVLSEVSCRRYVAMTVNTKDEAAAKAYEDFVSNVDPLSNEFSDKLNKKLMAHPAKDQLKDEFGVWFKSVQVSLDLFSPANIPLETEETIERLPGKDRPRLAREGLPHHVGPPPQG